MIGVCIVLHLSQTAWVTESRWLGDSSCSVQSSAVGASVSARLSAAQLTAIASWWLRMQAMWRGWRNPRNTHDEILAGTRTACVEHHRRALLRSPDRVLWPSWPVELDCYCQRLVVMITWNVLAFGLITTANECMRNYPQIPWWWRQQAPLKRRWTSSGARRNIPGENCVQLGSPGRCGIHRQILRERPTRCILSDSWRDTSHNVLVTRCQATGPQTVTWRADGTLNFGAGTCARGMQLRYSKPEPGRRPGTRCSVGRRWRGFLRA
jgi:hypothetical protein